MRFSSCDEILSIISLGIGRRNFPLATKEQAAHFMAWWLRRGWRQGERMPGMVKEDKPSSDQIKKLSVIKYEQVISRCEKLLKKKGLL